MWTPACESAASPSNADALRHPYRPAAFSSSASTVSDEVQRFVWHDSLCKNSARNNNSNNNDEDDDDHDGYDENHHLTGVAAGGGLVAAEDPTAVVRPATAPVVSTEDDDNDTVLLSALLSLQNEQQTEQPRAQDPLLAALLQGWSPSNSPHGEPEETDALAALSRLLLEHQFSPAGQAYLPPETTHHHQQQQQNSSSRSHRLQLQPQQPLVGGYKTQQQQQQQHPGNTIHPPHHHHHQPQALLNEAWVLPTSQTFPSPAVSSSSRVSASSSQALFTDSCNDVRVDAGTSGSTQSCGFHSTSECCSLGGQTSGLLLQCPTSTFHNSDAAAAAAALAAWSDALGPQMTPALHSASAAALSSVGGSSDPLAPAVAAATYSKGCCGHSSGGSTVCSNSSSSSSCSHYGDVISAGGIPAAVEAAARWTCTCLGGARNGGWCECRCPMVTAAAKALRSAPPYPLKLSSNTRRWQNLNVVLPLVLERGCLGYNAMGENSYLVPDGEPGRQLLFSAAGPVCNVWASALRLRIAVIHKCPEFVVPAVADLFTRAMTPMLAAGARPLRLRCGGLVRHKIQLRSAGTVTFRYDTICELAGSEDSAMLGDLVAALGEVQKVINGPLSQELEKMAHHNVRCCDNENHSNKKTGNNNNMRRSCGLEFRFSPCKDLKIAVREGRQCSDPFVDMNIAGGGAATLSDWSRRFGTTGLMAPEIRLEPDKFSLLVTDPLFRTPEIRCREICTDRSGVFSRAVLIDPEEFVKYYSPTLVRLRPNVPFAVGAQETLGATGAVLQAMLHSPVTTAACCGALPAPAIPVAGSSALALGSGCSNSSSAGGIGRQCSSGGISNNSCCGVNNCGCGTSLAHPKSGGISCEPSRNITAATAAALAQIALGSYCTASSSSSSPTVA